MTNTTHIKILISRLKSKREILQSAYDKLDSGQKLSRELRTYQHDVRIAEAMVRQNFKNRNNL